MYKRKSYMKKQKRVLSLGLLALSSILFAGNVSATQNDSAQVRAIKDEKLEMSLSAESIQFVLDDDSLKTKNLTVSVSSNNPNGYTVSMGVKNDYTELRNNDSTRIENVTIPALTEDKTEKEFNETAWGYNVMGYFTGLKTEQEGIFRTKEEGARDHILTFGVRAIGNDIVAGTYENEILISAVGNYSNDLDDNFKYVVCEPRANAIEDDGLSTTFVAQCMQDINKEVIETMEKNKTYWLYDSRDGKRYSVVKIYNEQVWMTKNLDLILDENMTLTNDSTDLNTKEEWTPNHSTKNKLSRDFDYATDTFNPGDLYYNDDNYETTDICRESFNSGSCTLTEFNGVEQFKVGTYYTYSAAVAENGEPNLDSTSAKNSVCPKGWKLPSISDYLGLNNAVANDRYNSLENDPYYFRSFDIVYEGKNLDGDAPGLINGYNISTLYWTSSYKHDSRESYYYDDDGTYHEIYNNGIYAGIFTTTTPNNSVMIKEDGENYASRYHALIRCVSR